MHSLQSNVFQYIDSNFNILGDLDKETEQIISSKLT